MPYQEGFGSLYQSRSQAQSGNPLLQPVRRARKPRASAETVMAEPSCAHGAWIAACPVCKPIHSSKDQQWNFVYPFKPKDQVQITSKGQFLRECKKRKLRWTGYDDLVKNGVPYHANDKPIDTSKMRPVMEQVLSESKDRGRVERKWQQLKAAGAVKED